MTSSKSHPSRARQLGTLRALAFASLVVPLLLLGLFAWQSWGGALRDAEAQADRQARVMAEHMRALLQVHELAVTRIAARLAAGNPDPLPDARAVHDLLTRFVGDSPDIAAISVAGPGGELVAVSTAHPPPPVTLADRDYFRSARGGEELVIGAPVVGRVTGAPTLPVARRVAGGGGAFGGVVVSGVALRPLEAFFSTLGGAPGWSVTVARADGRVLMRLPVVTTGVEMLSRDSGFMRTIAARPDGGTYRTLSELDRVERLHVVRPVADHDMHVSLGVSMDAVFQTWLRAVGPMAAVALLGGASLLAMALLAIRRARGEAASVERWQQEVARRGAAEAALAQAQKLEAVGQLTGGVAHDVNNHLQVIAANLQLLKGSPRLDATDHVRVDSAQAGVERAASLTGKLLSFARKQPLEPRSVNLARVVRGMADMLRRTLGEGVEVETVVDGGLWNAVVDPVQVENAVLNLAVNARDAMAGRGRLTVEVGNAKLDDEYAAAHAEVNPGQYVVLAVSDTGAGMPADVVARAFEPFFTTKRPGEGTGLGLAMVHGFAKQSGGHVKIYSEPGQGTTVKVYLPRSRTPEEALPTAGAEIRGGSESVLVAEDDEAVRRAVAAMVASLGYQVLEAKDAASALALLQGGAAIDLLFTDVVMPGDMTTPEFVRQAQAMRPGLKVLYTSGYTANAIVHHGRLDEGVALMPKPYTRDALARKLRQVLDVPDRTAAGAAPVASPAPAALRILLVEDEALIAMATSDILQGMGHDVLEARDVATARRMLADGSIDLLLTDLQLPDGSGRELAAEARRSRPGLAVVFATGRSDQELDGVTLRKPYSDAALRQAIAAARQVSV